MKKQTKVIITMMSAGLLLAGLVGFSIYYYYQQSAEMTDYLISRHIEELSSILHKIDEDVAIQNIKHNRSYIDFLNIGNFAGSEVGPLNVAHPQRWEGPYMQDNPTMQGKLYEIVKTHEGYYIVPGEGVKLENGKVIGKDIVFSYDGDMESFVNDTVGLEYNGKSLIARFVLKKDKKIQSIHLPDTE